VDVFRLGYTQLMSRFPALMSMLPNLTTTTVAAHCNIRHSLQADHVVNFLEGARANDPVTQQLYRDEVTGLRTHGNLDILKEFIGRNRESGVSCHCAITFILP
jgi:hypothetical protein